MIRCDAILGNIDDDDSAFQDRQLAGTTQEQDEFDFAWSDAGRRFLRSHSRAGREVGVLLPLGSRLRNGDILYAVDGLILIARLLPARVLLVNGLSPRDLCELAYELGNLHSPIEVRDDHSLMLPDDDVLRAWLRRRGIKGEPKLDLFKPLQSGVAADMVVTWRYY